MYAVECAQMIDVRPLFDAEIKKGRPSGPMFVNGWPPGCDPRFTDPVNPLYDPFACRDTDWRSKLDIVGYLRFSDYVAHVKGMLYRYVIESAEDENIFNVSSLFVFLRCSVLDCVTQCSQSAAHLYEQFLQVQQIGFVTSGPL